MSSPGSLRMRHVFVVSDATGTTCDMVVQAALSQFRNTQVVVERVPYVRSAALVRETVARAARVHGVVIYTMVTPELRRMLLEEGLATGVPTVDILGPLLTRLSDLLEISPVSQPGLFRELDTEYFNRIDAVDYTVKHDDGLGLDTLGRAEIVIVGVSRSSKTPVSLYLSFRGWKVANVPIVPGLEVPPELLAIEQERIVGFTVDPPFLHLLRVEREKHLGARLGSYTDENEIVREVTYARRICFEHGWPVLNVTAKAIEEAATEVMGTIYARTGQRKGSITE